MDKLIALAKNPVPSGAIVGTFRGHDGTVLRYARWEPTRGPRRGTVCLFGGRGEFIEKYFEVVADLRRRGFAVATMDWRGQGGSDRTLANPRKGHVVDFAEHDGDLLRFMKDIVLPDCLPPFIALAHSMGGHLLIRNALATGSWFERMVLVAPMLAVHPVRLRYPVWYCRSVSEAAALARLGQRYVPGGSDLAEEMKGFENNPLTSDAERFHRNKAVLEAAPELAQGSPTIAWLRAALRSMSRLAHPDTPSQVKVPLLVFSAGQDKVVSSRAIEIFANRLKVGTHILLPASRHEILQENDEVRARFWAAFDAYLDADTGALSR